MAFDICPPALQPGRVASFKATDQIGAAWTDLSGNYSLTGHSSPSIRHPRDGRTTLGLSTVCDWQAQQCWSTTDADLIRNGQSWTKCGLISTTYPDFDAQAAIVSGLYSSTSGGTIDMGATRTAGGAMFWLHVSPVGNSGAQTRTTPIIEPILFTARCDHSAPSVTYSYWAMNSGEKINERTYNVPLGNRDSEFYGRRGTAGNATYNGSQTVVDCIQIFDSSLPDTQLQLICSYLWNQRQNMFGFFSGRMSL